MTTITKERIKLFIKNPLDNGLTRGEQMELARIALASLEAEPIAWADNDELPLDYLQGQKDGLEWAAQLAEANHPQTGDWLYDDPVELAKAIRKGPDMPEAAGNSPVIPSEVLSAILKFARVRADFDDFDGDRRGIGDCLDEAEQELIVTINKYASQLAAEPIAPNDVREQTAIPQVPVTPDGWISCSERMPNDAQWCVVNTEYGYYVQCWSEGQGWLGDDISIPECDVINWMPLPEPPQEVKRG
ncbi:DUF551 domain-containing protein [Escherichia coli]|nr:DUF551 domain-containing protein [Escherichia coli]